MDPVAMAGSALSVLNAIKEQVKECEAAFQDAAALNEMIKGFEVVLMMIPSRASAEEEESGEENEESKEGTMSKMVRGVSHMAQTVGNVIGEDVDHDEAVAHGKNYAKEKLKAMVGESVGGAFELFSVGKDLEPIFNDEPNPGEKLQAMKDLVDASNMRVFSDLEVMFQGMAYTVLAALKVINGAVDQLKELDKLGTPSSYWACMPWKVSQTLAIKEDLNGHVEDLKHQINMLQTAIGVASYAVQLEQMESMMDATSSFKHRDMRSLWKKRIGSDKSRVPLAEFVDAFFCEKPDVLTVNKAFEETVGRRKDPNIALARFLSELINENNDDDISVYELNSVMTSAEKHSKFLKPLDSVGYTIHTIIENEKKLMRAILFFNVQIDAGDDGVVGTQDDKAEIIPNGEALIVRPFHKALIIGEIPLFDQQIYQFDSLVLLQFQNPKHPLTGKLKDHYEFSVMEETRCYLSKDTSSLVISQDESKWNAYKSFRNARPPRFDKRFNFEEFKNSKRKKKKKAVAVAGVEKDDLDDLLSSSNKIGGNDEKDEEEKEEEEKEDKNVKKEETMVDDVIMGVANDDDDDDEEEETQAQLDTTFDDRIRILYTPSMMYPGHYSPRYCLDAYQDQNDGMLKKKLAISPRSYYRGNVEGYEDEEGKIRDRAHTVVKPKKQPKRRTSVLNNIKNDMDDKVLDRESLAKLGPVIYVPDINEMVFGEKVVDDDFMEENEDIDHSYVPYLSKNYPYFPKRTVWIPYSEDLSDAYAEMSVFINRKQTRKRERLESIVPLPDDCTHVGIFMDSGRKEPDAKGRQRTVWTFIKEKRIDDEEPNHLFPMGELLNDPNSIGYHNDVAKEYRICFTKRTRVQGQPTQYTPLLHDRDIYPYLTVWVGKEEEVETYKQDSSDESSDEESDDDEDRPPHPGSFTISGATGQSASRVNGTFEPHREVQIGLPVYRKKNDPDTWIEAVKGASGYRWYLKPAANKGPNSSICFAYVGIDPDNLALPLDITTPWTINTANGFTEQKSIVLSKASDKPTPFLLEELVRSAQKAADEADALAKAERERPPHAGAFTITTATGKSKERVNGTFEPTEEVQLGLPVYKKKGDDSTFIEACSGKNLEGELRWYLKPVANRGPESSICFAYIKIDLKNAALPDKMSNAKWKVHTASGWEDQNIGISSASNLPLPDRIVKLLDTKKKELAEEARIIDLELSRPPLPGSFTVEGATGNNEGKVNGTFEPTEEVQNDLPVYVMKGNSGMWCEAVKGASGWRWYIKPTANKGPDSSVCFAYANFTEDDVVLPHQIDTWIVYADQKFAHQSSVKISLAAPLSEKVEAQYNRGKKIIESEAIRLRKLEELKEKESRPPHPGSFKISGSTGKSAKRMNGIFEPTDEVQWGLPVFQKKGDEDTWVEAVSAASGLRWYLKPAANKGPNSSICFGYIQVDTDDVCLPQNMSNKDWTVNTDTGFVPQKTIVESASDEPIPTKIMDLVNSAKEQFGEKARALKKELERDPIAGSFSLAGASGKNDEKVNGTFEPTKETQNGFPVYKKKGNDDLWVEAVKGTSGWRWYLKPTANKGPDSSICFAYMNFNSENAGAPPEVEAKWTVHTADGFVEQDVTTVGVGGSSERVMNLVTAAKKKIRDEDRLLREEVERPPVAGSFTLSGAEGNSAGNVNGTFEPTGEKQRGLPVYRKKGNANLFCEAAKGGNSSLRWYIKPAANRGPDSTICFGYAAIDENDKALPQDITSGWTVNTKDGFKMQESIHVVLASEEPIPDNMVINPMQK